MAAAAVVVIAVGTCEDIPPEEVAPSISNVDFWFSAISLGMSKSSISPATHNSFILA